MVSWSSKPYVILDADAIGTTGHSRSFLQSASRVPAMTAVDGRKFAEMWIMAQDPGGDYQNVKYFLFDAKGKYTKQYMYVKGSKTHGRSFMAFRDQYDGGLWVWTHIGSKAYVVPWTKGTIDANTKFVRPCSASNGDYKGRQPIQTHDPYIAFREDSGEYFSLHDRSEFLRGREAPIKTANLSTSGGSPHVSQAWAASVNRIYNFSGATNHDAGHGSDKHELDVWDWNGKHIGKRIDLTKMSIPTSSDEPEGITFSGEPGQVMLGKREGSAADGARSYPIWIVTGLP